MQKQVDGITFIDKGKYVIITDNENKKSLCTVSFAKKMNKRFFVHKHKRCYIE